jgi:hypothetical protein
LKEPDQHTLSAAAVAERHERMTVLLAEDDPSLPRQISRAWSGQAMRSTRRPTAKRLGSSAIPSPTMRLFSISAYPPSIGLPCCGAGGRMAAPILWDMHTDMDEYDGAVWIDDGTENGTAGFTEFGLESLTEMLPHYLPATTN